MSIYDSLNLCWPQIKAFEWITVLCKNEGRSKIFDILHILLHITYYTLQILYITQKLFIVYKSVKHTFLPYSCQQLVEVMSL